MYCSTGIVKYSDNPKKLILEVDQNIANYYKSLIPKYIKTNKPLYPAHISIIRNEDFIFDESLNNKEFVFYYDGIIYVDTVYIWIDAFSIDLESVRLNLGLTKHSNLSKPPNNKDCFHITIANRKGIL